MDRDLRMMIWATVFCVCLFFIYSMTAILKPDQTTACIRSGGEWVESPHSFMTFCRKIFKKEVP